MPAEEEGRFKKTGCQRGMQSQRNVSKNKLGKGGNESSSGGSATEDTRKELLRG